MHYENKTKVSSESVQSKRVIAIGAVFSALTLISACSSSGGSGEPAAVVNPNETVTPSDDANTGDNANNAPGTPAGTGAGSATDMIGTWVICSETPGIRLEYVFTATTYSNTYGAGTCAGYQSADENLVNSGPYSITGTTTADSGVTAYQMELMTTHLNGAAIFESLRETRYRLVYTGVADQLNFSDDTFEGETRSNTIDFDLTFVRAR